MTFYPNTTTGDYVSLDGERYYRIANSHHMEEFFMSLVGAGDHWMFISSCGALTAGRRNADNALFPYASDDKISAGRGETGSVTLVRIGDRLWEPFAPHSIGTDRFRRNLYKTPLGTKLVFEEVNESLDLTFRYRWTFSKRFGFIRSCRLENTGAGMRSLKLLDGLRNVVPYGVGSEFLMRFSNLANAYKKSELIAESNVGLFYLSSIPTDRAEPSEGLKATTVWQTGLTPDAVLLSADQIPSLRAGEELHSEEDVRGKAGAYLLNQVFELAPFDAIEWHLVAELAQDHSAVVELDEWLRCASDPAPEINADVHSSEQEFRRILSSSDAIQCGANQRRTNRHLSNAVFNIMRGGVPVEDYRVHSDDFRRYLANFNHDASDMHKAFLANLPDVQLIENLRSAIAEQNDPTLTRLGLEYLPLAFSRRHGDPTRPWNHFSIDLQSEDGRTNLNYQGNWRDIFQNWEALLLSFPEFSTAMICRFVNATTADGYNPYRLTRNGFEWEEPAPDDPWANIGYWGDHQIIYLLKLLEWTRRFYPQGIDPLLDSAVFTHANVPYRIKNYEAIKHDPRDTIEFDRELSIKISHRVATVGMDGKLLCNARGSIHYVTLVEKILTLSLAKMANFIPDGGIWLNTQRPEWNDANNALVGNGLSMVTACYLHRWFKFLHEWFSLQSGETFRISKEVADSFNRIDGILQGDTPAQQYDSQTRLQLVDALSSAGSEFRSNLYANGLSGEATGISRRACLAFFDTARRHLEATIRNNRRPDGLYHSYNLLDRRDDGLDIEHLYEMLEGQVAALSSELLTATEAVEVIDSLRASKLYRQNQDSYILYPDRRLQRFLEKNQISQQFANSDPLLQKLLANGDRRIVQRDVREGVHFNGQFRNSADLREALNQLGKEYENEVSGSAPRLMQHFEDMFGHRQFTGRSGTFFAYEGLGSIYWHMVSKLSLAVCENYFWAIEVNEPAETIAALKSHYEAIRHGIGAEKSPEEYGAFPSDPYSHTPENAGVKQPGMTGQVKEDILARFSELGIHIEDGCLRFRLELFDQSELLKEPGDLEFFGLNGEFERISVPTRAFGFTLFQVPIVYQPGERDRIEVHSRDGGVLVVDGLTLDTATSRQLFARSGTIERITCYFKALMD